MNKGVSAKAVHVYYSGRVQGVGFRFRVEYLANDLGLLGWVMNLSDGRVELLAEGKEAQLNKLLARIDNEFPGYIRQKQLAWSQASGEFNSFKIRFF